MIDTDFDHSDLSITDIFIQKFFVINSGAYNRQPDGYLYREDPDCDDNSGLRSTTIYQTDEYMDDTDN